VPAGKVALSTSIALPEILTRFDANNTATVRPLAGTRKRGSNEAEDLALEKDLLADEKEIAEHLMDLRRTTQCACWKSSPQHINRIHAVLQTTFNI
jgi:anthranilate/para-aminobenzoate synthase component I